MIRGSIRRYSSGDCPSSCNNNTILSGEMPSIEFPLYDQEIYFNQVTVGRIFPQPPPQLRAAPPPNWLFSNKSASLGLPCPFDTSSLNYYQTYLGLKILENCDYILLKQTCKVKGHRKQIQVYMKYTYEILSPSGSLIFCKTEAMNCVQRFMSCGISSYSRPYIAKLIDAWATRTLIIKQNVEKLPRFPKWSNEDCCLAPVMKRFVKDRIEYLITLENGYIIGTISRAKAFRRLPRYYISNIADCVTVVAAGQRELRKHTMPSVVKSSLIWIRSHYSFTFAQVHCYRQTSYHFQYLATATKFLDTLTKSEEKDSNRYIFKLQYDDNLDIMTKILLLGSCLVIDYDYWRCEM